MDRQLFDLADQVDTSVGELKRVSVSIMRTYEGMAKECPEAEPGKYPDPLKGAVFAARARAYIEQMGIFIDKLSQEINVLQETTATIWANSEQERLHKHEKEEKQEAHWRQDTAESAAC